MKTETVILVAVLVIGGVVAYSIYQKNNSQLSIGRNGVTGQLNISQLSGIAGTLIGDIGNAFGGSNQDNSANSDYTTYLS